MPPIVENTFYITRIEDLNLWDSSYKRVYYGCEFCEGLIPRVDDLKIVIDFVRKSNLNFSFVTCPVSNNGVRRFERIARFFTEEISDRHFEVIINDWGLLEVFNGLGCTFSLGRLLIRQKCDPRITSLMSRSISEVKKQLTGISINKETADFLKSKNILRLELDNPCQGLALDDTYGLRSSLYTPFGYITLSRICHYSSLRDGSKREVSLCDGHLKGCRDGKFILENPSFEGKVYIKGNAIFFRNEKIPSDLLGSIIDRIVFEPGVPS